VQKEIQCEERGQITVKGLAYPVATYRVIDAYDKLGAARKRFCEELPNLKLDLDVGSMSRDQREQALAILQKALDELSE
jgi:hypothetical protein